MFAPSHQVRLYHSAGDVPGIFRPQKTSLHAPGDAQRSSRLLKLEATFCLRFLQGGVETILTRKELS